MRRSRTALAALILALVAVPAAVAGAQTTGARVDRLDLSFPADDGSLTPYTFKLGYGLMTLVYDTLMWRDEDGVPRPWLASSVRVGDRGREVTVTLRRGARWHDGRPVTARDVAFTFGYLRDRPHPRFTPQLGDIESVTQRGRLTAVFRLARPSAGFIDQPLADVPILPEHLWRDVPLDRLAPAGPVVGSGPFRLVEAGIKGYRFRAVDRYFLGRPSVGELRFRVEPEFPKLEDLVRNRRIDALTLPVPPGLVRALGGFGLVSRGGPSYSGTHLLFNTRRPPFDDPDVRRAVSRALDLDRIARNVGNAVPATHGVLHPASRWAPERALHVFDPKGARDVLDRAGVPEVRVLASEFDPARKEAGEQVVLSLERIGLRARLVERTPTQLARSIGQDGGAVNFDAAIWVGPALASWDPEYLRRIFGSDAATSPLNYSGYRSERFDAAAMLAAGERDAGRRRELVADELTILAEDAPVVALVFTNATYIVRPAVYDGWVNVRGGGILDKQSFLADLPQIPAVGPRPVPPPGFADADEPYGPLILIPLAVLAVALIAGVFVLVRQRPRE